jgi:2-polyprenyl-3-methyl-5-hydroxy-6-metoxy-1,4-benzoquinol methylase
MDLKGQQSGEYSLKGDYHKKIDKAWHYFPVFVFKMKEIEIFFKSIPKSAKILDLGCGEGYLVEKYQKMGYDITGLDINYSSEYVRKGDIRATRFEDDSFDIILCLDVIEHLHFSDQSLALKEIYRILKKDGIALLALPNLAHFASRISFLCTGSLLRTSKIERHPGDRPINEYIKEIKENHFFIVKRTGIFPTLVLSSILTWYFPQRVIWLHKIINKLFAYPNWCFLNLIHCKKI